MEQSRSVFENYYTPRRSHDAPNLTARFIIETYMPETEYIDDPLAAGHYFAPRNFLVNEFHTPIGYKLMQDQANTIRLIGQYSPGFINDVCQLTSFRFTDRYARQSPGRAFSADRGEYLVAAFGQVERYRMINSFADGGHQQSMISDWGMISYMLSAHSASNAFESGCPFVSTTGMRTGLAVSRNLLGEKPISVLTSYGLDNIGRQFAPEDFTAEGLRDYYRYAYRRLMLTAFEAGYYVDPPLLHGKHWNSEVNPILVESLVYGRKTISGARSDAPWWMLRGGEGAEAVFVAGNSTAGTMSGEIELLHSYLGGNYVWAPYFGGTAVQTVTDETTELMEVTVPAHDIAAYKPVAQLYGTTAEKLHAQWGGDGLELEIRLDAIFTDEGRIRILMPAEYYSIASVLIDGQPVVADADGLYLIHPGKRRIEAGLRNTVLQLDPHQWRQVELILNDTPNFCLIATTEPGYELGTAMQMNWFLRQYDEENGIPGSLADAEVYSSMNRVPQTFTGWKIDLRPDPLADELSVRMDTQYKQIYFSGRTPGEIRKAMMLFLRLVDRKYPHIGRNVPLERNLREGWRQPGWHASYDPENAAWKRLYGMRRPDTTRFFEEFDDGQFLLKPILEQEYEHLYADGNLDFTGKYSLRFSPYLFEPTFGESFVYGYSGPRSRE